MRYQLVAAALLTLLAPIVRSVDAQPSSVATVAARLGELRVGAPVRVSTAGALTEGRMLRLDADSLVLRGPNYDPHIPLLAIDTLWVGHRNTGSGAEIGAVLCAISLAAIAVSVVKGQCDSEGGCQSDVQSATVGGFLVGAGVGGLLGAGIGSITGHWERRYP